MVLTKCRLRCVQAWVCGAVCGCGDLWSGWVWVRVPGRGVGAGWVMGIASAADTRSFQTLVVRLFFA